MDLERVRGYCLERGIDLGPTNNRERHWARIVEELLTELETLRRIRHLALSYREAQIECNSSFAEAPRRRRHRRCVELDALLGIEEDYRGVM